MWDTLMPNTCCNWEPVELRILKKELAKLDCNCNTCEFARDPTKLRENSCLYQNDASIQVERQNGSFDRFIYGYSKQEDSSENSEAGQTKSDMMGYFRNDMYCPNCLLIWDLIRELRKVFKDEECEIRSNMFSSDKSTEQQVEFVDSTTSVTNKPAVAAPTSNLTLCDFITETSSVPGSLMTTPAATSHSKLRSNQDKVTFLDSYENNYHSCLKKKPLPPPLQGTCFCLENLIDNIRPPLAI